MNSRTFLLGLALLAGALPSGSAAIESRAGNCREESARAFDFFIGDWTIRQRILNKDGTYLELPATSTVTPILDGCALLESWEGDVQFFWEGMESPGRMKAISIRAFDPRSKSWIIDWMDTRSRSFDTPYVGEVKGNRGEFFREWQTPEGTRIGRITVAKVTADSLDWSLDVSVDNRLTWTTIWTMGFRRTE